VITSTAVIALCLLSTISIALRPTSAGKQGSRDVTLTIESTVRHLGIEVDDALAIAEQVEV